MIFTILIYGLRKQGEVRRDIKLYKEMCMKGVSPDAPLTKIYSSH